MLLQKFYETAYFAGNGISATPAIHNIIKPACCAPFQLRASVATISGPRQLVHKFHTLALFSACRDEPKLRWLA